MSMWRSAWLTGMWLAMSAGAVWAQDSGSFRYREILSSMHVDQVVQNNPVALSRLQFKLRLTPHDRSVSPGDLTLSVPGSNPPMVFRANRFGAFDLPLTKALFDANPELLINKSYGQGLSVGVDLKLVNASPNEIAASTVMAGIKEYKDALSHAGLMVRLLAPGLKTLVLRTSTPSMRCTLQGDAPPRDLPAPDARGELRIDLTALQGDGVRRVSCDQAIDETLLEA